MANNKINVTDLDFDQIKNNLKEFFRGQSEFTDYDFEGSALSTLLDILAYNTHYQGLYYNLAVNESFLDSASKRSSVVSKASELGYVPKSITSSRAVLNIVMIDNQLNAPAAIELPKYTPFTTQIDGVAYTFYTTESQVANKQNFVYSFTDITIVEGYPLTYRYVIDDSNSNSIIIPNSDVDISTLKVKVQNNVETADFDVFAMEDSIINLTGDSKVFFLKELSSGQYELQFGNGVIGKPLSPGNIITIEYFVSKGPLANGAKTFSFAGQLAANTSISILTKTPSFGGSSAESINSIRWNAPRAYTTQNRCVTENDYKTLILKHYQNARSVSVWGGQDNIPPQYGKVFISIIPQSGERLTAGEKQYIINTIVNPRKTLTVFPEIVDATNLDIEIKTTVYYNPLSTTNSLEDISSAVLQTILSYNNENLNVFDGVFKYSKLITAIDNSDPAINSNITTIQIRREIQPIFDSIAEYIIPLGNPIARPKSTELNSISSTGFYTSDSDEIVYLDDVINIGSSTGIIRLYYVDALGNKNVIKNVGTVDYSSGLIILNNINITASLADTLDLIINPDSNDIVSFRNQFIKIDPKYVTISVLPDSRQQPYIFTSNQG